MVEVGIIDWGIWLVYFAIMFLTLFIYKNSKSNPEHYSNFINGFLIRAIGGVAFVYVYIYYYGFGDTFLYFKGARELSNTMISDPTEYFRLIFSKNGNLPADLGEYATIIPYSRTAEEWFMVKLLSPLTLISFNSYLVTTLFISLIAFYGSWKIYQVFKDLWPEGKKYVFIAVFLVPSVSFWSTGLLKDSIAFSAVNCLIYAVYFIITKKEFSLGKICLALISMFLLYQLKIYILFSFIPAVFVLIYAQVKTNIHSNFIRILITPILLLLISFFAFFVGRGLIQANQEFSAEGLEKQAKGFHSWHTTTAGSAYNLGEVNYTVGGVLQKIPASLNVTFFRPYFWESNNVVMLASAVESFIVLLLFIYVLFRWKGKLFSVFRQRPMLQMFLVYLLVFGFAVGFTSYNFGALVRYKLPIYSITFFVLCYLALGKKKTILGLSDSN